MICTSLVNTFIEPYSSKENGYSVVVFSLIPIVCFLMLILFLFTPEFLFLIDKYFRKKNKDDLEGNKKNDGDNDLEGNNKKFDDNIKSNDIELIQISENINNEKII
jgi:hypothetical protein